MQFNQSEEIGELVGALAKAQSEMSKAHKDSENPFFHSKYADIGSIIDASLGALNSNNIAVLQPFKIGESNSVIITTLLAHSSGQWIRGELLMNPEKDTAQALGSVLTYGRRYSLQSMICIAAEDDDAESGMNRDKYKKKPAEKKKPDPPKPAEKPKPEMSIYTAEQIKRGGRIREYINALLGGDMVAIESMYFAFGKEMKVTPKKDIAKYGPEQIDAIFEKYQEEIELFEKPADIDYDDLPGELALDKPSDLNNIE